MVKTSTETSSISLAECALFLFRFFLRVLHIIIEFAELYHKLLTLLELYHTFRSLIDSGVVLSFFLAVLHCIIGCKELFIKFLCFFYLRALHCIIGCKELLLKFLSFFFLRVLHCIIGCKELFIKFLSFFFLRVRHCIIGCTELFLKLLSFLQSQVIFFVFEVIHCSKMRCKYTSRDFETNERIKNLSISSQQFSFNGKGDVMKMRREEVEMVMGDVGIFCDSKGEELKECLDSGDLSLLFDEEEPNLGELKEAFCVFDENGDGFIHPTELQRVLRNLGFREGSNIYACKGMIAAFDRNGDGQIDFNEFLKLMEKSFC